MSDDGYGIDQDDSDDQQKQIQAAWWRKRQQELADLKAVMRLPEGRRFLRRMISRCKVFDDFEDTNATIYRKAGMRSIGLELNLDIQAADQSVWLQIQQEFLNDELRKRVQQEETVAV